MKEIFSCFLLIPQQVTKNNSGQNSSAMAPIVNSRNQQPEDKEKDHPDGNLSVQVFTIHPAAAFTIVEDSPYQPAYRGRSSDSQIYAGQIGDPESDNAAEGVDSKHPIDPKLPVDDGSQLI